MTDALAEYGALDIMSDRIHLLGEGLEWGAPEAVLRSARSQLRDGDVIASDRDTNRRLVLPLVIAGTDNREIAEIAAELTLESRKPRNELRFKWDGMNTPTSVYETFVAVSLTPVHNDVARLRDSPHQVYVLTLDAMPFAMSEATTTQTFTTGLGGVLDLAVGGSVRTSGDIELVSVGTDPLGDVMVLTRPNWTPDWSPALLSYLDASVYRIPATQLREGAYSVSLGETAWGSSPSGAINLNAELTTAAGSSKATTATTQVIADLSQGLVHLGALHLPIAPVAATSDLEVRIQAVHDTTMLTGTPFLIPMDATVTYLKNVDQTRAWIKAPSLDYPFGAVLVGNEPDASDAYGFLGSTISYGAGHELGPETSSVYAWCSGALSEVSASWRKRWHTDAAE